MNYELCIMNYELFYGVPAIAVGLSAISFSAALQKDAAPIPNALGATDSESLLLIDKALLYSIFVSPFQGFKFSRRDAEERKEKSRSRTQIPFPNKKTHQRHIVYF